jgi:hypothetical protein
MEEALSAVVVNAAKKTKKKIIKRRLLYAKIF